MCCCLNLPCWVQCCFDDTASACIELPPMGHCATMVGNMQHVHQRVAHDPRGSSWAQLCHCPLPVLKLATVLQTSADRLHNICAHLHYTCALTCLLAVTVNPVCWITAVYRPQVGFDACSGSSDCSCRGDKHGLLHDLRAVRQPHTVFGRCCAACHAMSYVVPGI